MNIKKYSKTALCLFLSVTMICAVLCLSFLYVSADEYCSITYEFTGSNAYSPGYAQGTVTLTAHIDGEYALYWTGEELSADDYYPILECTLSEGESCSVTFGYHTAIPAHADSITAFITENDHSSIAARYTLPKEKTLCQNHKVPLYTFNSYSDVHIDITGYYRNANQTWANALEFAAAKNSDFIVSSGDMITNNNGWDGVSITKEWEIYQTILNRSSYNNPVWESDGNHDMHTIGKPGLKFFVNATGTDDTFYDTPEKPPYYYIIEPDTGDLFIFMALEENSDTRICDEFSIYQRQWVEELLNTYYGTGINIYIIEHAPIEGFGAGDRMERPYYKGLLNPEYESTIWLRNILTEYKGVIHMSGHTHEDFCMGYNYSDEYGTACNMIHNPAVVGSTMPNIWDNGLDYNNGLGNNSQGYFVEVYQDEVIYYGANLTERLIYPLYSYIMEGTRKQDDLPIQPDTPDMPQTPDNPYPITDIVPISNELNDAKEILDYPNGASFTLHQELKKLYSKYRAEMYAPESVKDELVKKTAQLKELYEYLGVQFIYPIGDTYYFVNTKDWDNVYAYAYRTYSQTDPNNNDIRNAIWPGVKMKKVCTLDGYDVFRVQFHKKGQYKFIAFTDGINRTNTTALDYCKYNCFIIDETSSAAYNSDVKNIEYIE